MYKYFLSLLALFCFISCSSKVETPNQAGTENEEKTIEITVNNGAMEGDKKTFKVNEAKREAFYKHYPNIKIIPNSWQYTAETFMSKMAGGTCTDIIGLPNATDGIGLAERELALDLTPFIEKWDDYKYLNPTVVEPFVIDGKIYGLPGNVGYAMGLGINKDLFRAAGIVDSSGEPIPPKNWEEFVETAKKLTDRNNGVYGFVFVGKKGEAGWHFLNWAYQAGGEFERSVDGKWKAVFNEQPVVEALQFVQDMKWKHNFIQDNILMDNEEMLEFFASDKAGMAILAPYFIEVLSYKYNFPVEKIGFYGLPEGPGGKACVMGGGYSIINPTISSEKQDAAFRYLTYNLSIELWEVHYRECSELGIPVGLPGVALYVGEKQKEFEEMESKYRNVPLFPEYRKYVAKYARSEPPYYTQQLYSEVLLPAVQNVLTDKNADSLEILNKGAEMFQKRFLDKMENE